MATRYATKAGDWSDTTVWDGGALPADTDDVYANGFIVNINQTIIVNTLRATANTSPAISAGGKFVVTASATINHTAADLGLYAGTNGGGLIESASGSFDIVVNAPNVIGPNTTTNRRGIYLVSGFAGTLTVNGNVVGGTGSNSFAIHSYGATCAITVNGNVTGSAQGAIYIENDSTNTVSLHVVGQLTTTGAQKAIYGGSGSFTLDGDIHGGSSSGVLQWSGISMTITGDIYGGDGSDPVVSWNGRDSTGAGLGATVRGNLYPGSYIYPDSCLINAISGYSTLRYSGTIYSGGTNGDSAYAGAFPIWGSWVVIDGEPVNIHLATDSIFPHGYASEGRPGEITVSTTGGGALPPTIGQLWPR